MGGCSRLVGSNASHRATTQVVIGGFMQNEKLYVQIVHALRRKEEAKVANDMPDLIACQTYLDCIQDTARAFLSDGELRVMFRNAKRLIELEGFKEVANEDV